jgi:peptide/nickel transport system ATP-binding protein
MEPLIDIRNLRVAGSSGNHAETEIVKGVSFAVKRGEVMGLIGESGSGKTTIALSVMGYSHYGCRISGGSIRIGGTEVTKLDARVSLPCVGAASPI